VLSFALFVSTLRETFVLVEEIGAGLAENFAWVFFISVAGEIGVDGLLIV